MSGSSEAKPRERLEFIDGLRALAALFVVGHHAALYLRPIGAIPWLLGGIFAPGKFAVDLFIVLSGYCLALPLRRTGSLPTSIRVFFWRRLRRILPPYYAALSVSLLLVLTLLGKQTGTFWDRSIALTPLGFVSHWLLFQDWTGKWVSGQINYSLWSIATEWHIYFLFPLMLLSGLWRDLRVSLAWIIAPIVLAFWIQPTWLNDFNFSLLGLFCMGAIAARLSFDRGSFAVRIREHSWLGVTMVGVAACGAIWAWLPWPLLQRLMPVADFICGLAVSALLVELTARPHSRLRTVVSWPPLVTIGVFSYSLYLIHAPLLQLVWLASERLHLVSYPGNFLALFAAGLPLIVFTAWLFYLAFERPFLRKAQLRAINEELKFLPSESADTLVGAFGEPNKIGAAQESARG